MTKGQGGGDAGSLLIRGESVETVTRDVPVKSLNFYADNPRIYSYVRGEGATPGQEDILERLQSLEHVRDLVQDIRSNGGLIDPLIVRDGDMVVLEGNSRLAAYHHLAKEDPLRFSNVRCTLLPADIDEKLIFALLAQYHVKGKKDWAPYERAGFVYRRFKSQKVDLPAVAAEMGLTRDEAKHLVAVYEFMIQHDDGTRERWSYYDELLKSRKIRKVRDEVSGFDAFIVDQIKTGRFDNAMQLRDKLPIVCAANPKILKRYMAGTYDFSDAHEMAAAEGGEHHALNRLARFRKWIVESTTEDDVLEAPKTVRDKLLYELTSIEKKARKLRSLLDAKKSQIG